MLLGRHYHNKPINIENFVDMAINLYTMLISLFVSVVTLIKMTLSDVEQEIKFYVFDMETGHELVR